MASRTWQLCSNLKARDGLLRDCFDFVSALLLLKLHFQMGLGQREEKLKREIRVSTVCTTNDEMA